jgi:hypothetical protein
VRWGAGEQGGGGEPHIAGAALYGDYSTIGNYELGIQNDELRMKSGLHS